MFDSRGLHVKMFENHYSNPSKLIYAYLFCTFCAQLTQMIYKIVWLVEETLLFKDTGLFKTSHTTQHCGSEISEKAQFTFFV